MLETPAVALEATRRALRETAAETFKALRLTLGHHSNDGRDEQEGRLRPALESRQQFFATIPPGDADEPWSKLRVGQMHAIDHLARLQSRLTLPAGVRRVLADPRLQPAIALSQEILAQGEAGLHGEGDKDACARVERLAHDLAELRRKERPVIMQQTAWGAAQPGHALELLDAMRWLDRLSYHAWRICSYLGGEGTMHSLALDADVISSSAH